MMKTMSSLLLFVLAFSCLAIAEGNRPDKVWLRSLDDARPLRSVAFIGTHESASTYWYADKTQRKTITEQLEAGIRVLDMRVRSTHDAFAMYQNVLYMNQMFNDVVNDVQAFLQKHPREFVIMLMQEENTPDSSTKSNCQILEDHYFKQWPNLFAQRWNFRDYVGDHRGKILLAQRDNSGFSECSGVLYLPCKEQKDLDLAFFNGREKKWEKIRALQGEVSAKDHYYHCFINYLSAKSYWKSWETLANTYENPILWAYEEGMNNKFLSEFKNPQNTLYIVMADFPFEELTNLIVDSNDPDRKS